MTPRVGSGAGLCATARLGLLGAGLACLAIVAVAAAAAPRPPDDSPAQLLQAYVAAVTRGDWDEAAACWAPAELAAAARLAIHYRDVPLKVDCASPLLLRRDAVASGAADVRLGPAESDGARARIALVLRAAGDSIAVTCHLARVDGAWRLVTPTSALGGDWPVRETAFLRLHEQPPHCVPAAATARLDSMAARVCGALGASPGRVALLRREKIDYYFADAATVAALAGAPTVGVALLSNDAVVTDEPCHLHELAHLLVGFCAGEVGLYALPLLQEGAAVHFGGRWGRAPDALREVGRCALRTQLVDPDELLTWDVFQRSPADLTYAPAGVVAGLLLERLGGPAFLELYRGLSGTLAQVQALTSDQVRSRVAAALGASYADFAAALAARAREAADGDLAPGLPDVTGGAGDTLATVESGSLRVTVLDRGEWLGFAIVSTDGEAAGTLLLTGRERAQGGCAAAPDRLFAQQLPGQARAGESAGLIFDPREIGWYDFDCDLLLAKHVEAFLPDAGFVSADGRCLTFAVRRRLLPATSGPLTLRLQRRAGS